MFMRIVQANRESNLNKSDFEAIERSLHQHLWLPMVSAERHHEVGGASTIMMMMRSDGSIHTSVVSVAACQSPTGFIHRRNPGMFACVQGMIAARSRQNCKPHPCPQDRYSVVSEA